MVSGPDWPAPPAHPPLGFGEAHVWAVPLAPSAKLRALLAPDEAERAAAIRDPADAARWAAARAALRVLLGRYTGRDPRALRFQRGALGKPALRPDAGLGFNLSHTADLALVALTRGAEVGVDLERVRPVPRAERLVRRVFPAAERDAWAALPPDQREAGLCSAWTRVEAQLKALGLGVWHGAALREDAPWCRSLEPPAPGYQAALALTDGPRTVRCWTLQI